MIKNIESLSHCGIGLPTAIERTPSPLLTNRQRNRGLSARVVRRQPSCLWAMLLFAGSVFHPEMAIGQDAPSRAAAQAPSKARAASPVTMTECEGTNNCATWTFLGAQGNGQWPSGEVANLSVERYDNDSVVIRRADSTGSSAGLTVVYTGTRHGDRIGGEFTSSWPGHWDNKSGNWYATVEKNPLSPPGVMHWCAQHCTTWTLDKGAPFDKPHYGSEASGQIVIVERWTRESVVMNRRDNTPTFQRAAVLTGQLSSDGNSIVNGKIEWTPGGNYPFQAAWGKAINTVPASDAERGGGQAPQQQVVVVRPGPVCFPWFFGWVCE